MMKFTIVLIGLFVIIHFVLYYWNIDLVDIYLGKKTEIVDKKETIYEEPDNEDILIVQKDLEDSLNELKQYTSNNVNNESIESLD